MKQEAYDELFRLEDRHWWFLSRRAAIGPVIERAVPARDGQRILMVGCGTGGNVRLLTPKGQVFALDYSWDAVSRSRQRGEATLAQASAMALPYADETFDHVMCLAVLYHRGVTDDVAALREAWRVCKPGGVLVTTDPAFDFVRTSQHDELNQTGRRYTKRSIVQSVRRAGFKPTGVGYYHMSLLPIAFGVRRLQALLPQPSEQKSDLWLLPGIVNQTLTNLLRVEAEIGRRVGWPFGLSAYCVAHKTEA